MVGVIWMNCILNKANILLFLSLLSGFLFQHVKNNLEYDYADHSLFVIHGSSFFDNNL